jgi:hypothetical protein
MYLETSSQWGVWQVCTFTVLVVEWVKDIGKFSADGGRRGAKQYNCMRCFGDILWYGPDIKCFVTADVGENADVSAFKKCKNYIRESLGSYVMYEATADHSVVECPVFLTANHSGIT